MRIKDLMNIMPHFHEPEQAQFIMIRIVNVVANIVPNALTAKGALIVNPIANLIAGIKLSPLQALNALNLKGGALVCDNREFAGL